MTPLRETDRDHRLRVVRQRNEVAFKGYPKYKLMLDQYCGVHFFTWGVATERNAERNHKICHVNSK
jgi:hypothetical protein